MKNLLSDFLSIIYPDLCLICGENLMKNETQICTSCLSQIPRTNYHLQVDNPLEKRFWGKVPVFRATAFFYFQKGSPFQKLLHELKYRDNKEIGEIMGKHAAVDLLDHPDFKSVDVIIPIPLHPQKIKKRGYNQSECICLGLAQILNKPIDTTTIKRTVENTTQTKKSVFERFANTDGIFELTDHSALENKHVLLVDDVVTTGSTIEAAANVLQKVSNIKISVFCLAMA